MEKGRIMKKIQKRGEEQKKQYQSASKEELTKEQKEFIEDMAHEMKTPLTAILAFAEILSVKQDVTDEERRKYSEYIHEEAIRLKSMSDKLLQLAKSQETTLRKNKIFLRELLDGVLTAEQLICEREGIFLEAELFECSLEGEKDLLKSLFYNLIDNARKASKENGRILVRMKSERENEILVQVVDFGVGIPEEEIPYITEPFYIIDKSAAKQQRGTGLGLALCERIVRYHGGTLEIESQLGKGSTFTVCLPIQ